MPQDRFFIDAFFSQNQGLSLQDLEFHHLSHVMRVKEKETIELVNGQGQLALAEVLEIGKKNARLKINSLTSQKKPSRALILAQALPRANRLDFILEKGTELGMTEAWLFPSQLSEKKEMPVQRARQIAIAAMKQSGRLFLPEIRFFPSLKECPMSIQAYFGDLSEDAPPLAAIFKGQDATIFIGPEKGFSEGEIAWLKSQGALGVKLNNNILRTDTAALAALSILAALCQEN